MAKAAALIARIIITLFVMFIVNAVLSAVIRLAFDKSVQYKVKSVIATINEKCRNLKTAFRA